MRHTPYPTVADGEWVQPIRKGYRMACCDCNLVHRLTFRLLPWGKYGKKIQMQVDRDEPETKRLRRNARRRFLRRNG